MKINYILNSILFYSDDTTLYYSSRDLATAVRNITTDLENLTEWFKSNKLSFNIAKTSFMLFSKKHPKLNDDTINLSLANETINKLKLQSHIHGSGGGSWRISDGCGPPLSAMVRAHPPSSQSHYGGYATFLLRTRYDLMLSDGGLAADWRRTSGNRSRKTTVTPRWLASLGGRTTANPPRGAALLPRSVVETSECRSTTAAGPCP